MDRDEPRAWLRAHWPAPDHVHAGITTRRGGVSAAPYDTFNIAPHVGDRDEDVHENRRRLRRMLRLPGEPAWLDQQHGVHIVDLDHDTERTADAAYAANPGPVCALMTADCIPLLMCDRAGTEVAGVHVGWRGLCAGIVGVAVDRFRAPAREIMAWLGPGISAAHYPVGNDVREACRAGVPGADAFLAPAGAEKWRADLPGMVCAQLRARDVTAVFQAGLCTFARSDDFYSFRRDGQTGRMASLIWMDTPRR